jgi:hypothetical protein
MGTQGDEPLRAFTAFSTLIHQTADSTDYLRVESPTRAEYSALYSATVFEHQLNLVEFTAVGMLFDLPTVSPTFSPK